VPPCPAEFSIGRNRQTDFSLSGYCLGDQPVLYGAKLHHTELAARLGISGSFQLWWP
jgi:hypothetical protein